MTVVAASTPPIRRRRTGQWLRWWPVALIALFVLVAILAPLIAPTIRTART